MSFTHTDKFDENEPNWGDVDKTKLPAIAFAYVEDPEKKSTWKLPHHWVKNGTELDEKGVWKDGELLVHRAGVIAAYAALQGARSGDPMNVPDSARQHILEHRKVLNDALGKVYTTAEKKIFDKLAEDFIPVQKQIPITKQDNLNRVVYGVVYTPDEVDSQYHFMCADEVQRMAWRFMRAAVMGQAGIDYMHNNNNGSAIVVESWICRQDEYDADGKLLWRKNSWVMGVQILDPDVWAKILLGEIGAYSIAGNGEYGERIMATEGQNLPGSNPISEIKVR